MHSDVHAAELVFLLLLLFVVLFGVLSKKLKTPYPIVMVVGGLLLSLVPHVPNIELNPDLVFFVILPPLLYSAAFERLVFVTSVLERYSDHECSLLLDCSRTDILAARIRTFQQISKVEKSYASNSCGVNADWLECG